MTSGVARPLTRPPPHDVYPERNGSQRRRLSVLMRVVQRILDTPRINCSRGLLPFTLTSHITISIVKRLELNADASYSRRDVGTFRKVGQLPSITLLPFLSNPSICLPLLFLPLPFSGTYPLNQLEGLLNEAPADKQFVVYLSQNNVSGGNNSRCGII